MPEPVGPPSVPVVGSPVCQAPFTSLHLEPNGNVKACCMNHLHSLGNLHRSTLREIWDGEATRVLRRALEAGDLTRGCEQCASHIERGTAASAQLQVFEAYERRGPDPAWPSNLELALSNACNLQCIMCNGDLSSSIRIHREHRPPIESPYGDAFFDDLDEFLPHLRSVTFLGGEPFLARPALRVMDRLVELGLSPSISVITNGTQLTPQVERIVRSLPTHVSISIDAIDPERLSAIRVGVDAEALMANIWRFRALLTESGGGMALSFTLMRHNWDQLLDVLLLADRLECDVFVVKLFHPASHSLLHLPEEEVERICTELEHLDRRRGHELGRNAALWQEQLAWIRGVRGRRASAPTDGVAVSIDPRRADAVTIWTDGDLLVQRVDPVGASLAGVALEPLLGQSLVDVHAAIERVLGAAISTEVAYGADGTQHSTLRFASDAPVERIDASLSVTDDGRHRWVVAAGASGA